MVQLSRHSIAEPTVLQHDNKHKQFHRFVFKAHKMHTLIHVLPAAISTTL